MEISTSTTLMITLLVATLFWMAQAVHWKRKAQQAEHAAMGMAVDLSRVGKDSWNAGWEAGRKHGIGLMFKVAMKTEARGGDVLRALSDVRKQPEDESIVQVPIEA